MKYNLNNRIIEAGSRCEALESVYGGSLVEIRDTTPKPVKSVSNRIIDIRKSLYIKRKNGKMNKNNIDTIVVHHDAEYRPNYYDSIKRYQRQARLHARIGLNRLAYHLIIDNTGIIFQTADLTDVLFHSGNWNVNHRSIAIKFDGNCETQKPTPQQLQSYSNLIQYLTTQRPDLPKVLKRSIKGHKDIKATLCPGKNLYPHIRKV